MSLTSCGDASFSYGCHSVNSFCIEQPEKVVVSDENQVYDRMQDEFIEAHELEEGCFVKVMFSVPDNFQGWKGKFIKSKNLILKKAYRVESTQECHLGILIKCDNETEFYVPYMCLEIVEGLRPIKVELKGYERDAFVTDKTIKVGCQEFSIDLIKKLSNARAKFTSKLKQVNKNV